MKLFFSAFDVLPGWIWGAICAGLIAAYAITGSQLKTERLAHQTTKTAYATAVADAERASREQSEKYRAKEQELRHAEEVHAQEIATVHQRRDADRAASAAVVVRVRDAARETAALASQVHADTASAELRETAATATRMLAELRERADERAGILAQFATDAHLAGLACERRYDQARETLKE